MRVRYDPEADILYIFARDGSIKTITCDKFIDANGRIHYDWIPAIRLG